MPAIASFPILVWFVLLQGVSAQDHMFAPAFEAGANLPARPLEAGDLTAVAVYGAPELSRTVRVSAEGAIRLPMLERRIDVAGLMPAEMEQRIAEALVAEQILKAPAVTVTIAEYHSRPISVVGAVRQPVTFPAYGKTTPLEALARTQGLNAEAGTEILVTHPSRSSLEPATVERVSVKGLIDGADAAFNLMLDGGEEVRVPRMGRVFVVGNVRKPGGFPALDGAEMTVLKALALAEGLAPFSKKQAYIYRRSATSPSVPPAEIVVELRKIMDRKSPDVALGANDILYIPDSRAARASATTIEKVIAFVAGTASGALILSAER
jgi:polysaccharide biosynthesis/export protein